LFKCVRAESYLNDCDPLDFLKPPPVFAAIVHFYFSCPGKSVFCNATDYLISGSNASNSGELRKSINAIFKPSQIFLMVRILEPVPIGKGRRMGGGFSRQSRRFDAGILWVFQGEATRSDGKRPVQAVRSAYWYRFLGSLLLPSQSAAYGAR